MKTQNVIVAAPSVARPVVSLLARKAEGTLAVRTGVRAGAMSMEQHNKRG